MSLAVVAWAWFSLWPDELLHKKRSDDGSVAEQLKWTFVVQQVSISLRALIDHALVSSFPFPQNVF